METKKFHLGDLLSITTGKLLSQSHMEGIYGILNWMTGDNLFTHQLPRAMYECRPHLLEQFPALVGVMADDVTPENHKQWLGDAVEQHGEWFDVTPVPAGGHERRNPIEELADMVGPEKVLVVPVHDAEQVIIPFPVNSMLCVRKESIWVRKRIWKNVASIKDAVTGVKSNAALVYGA